MLLRNYLDRKRLDILVSPGFVVGLSLLLLNDLLLKPLFHNQFTGKLSDFSGLFVFPLFLTTVFPSSKGRVYWITALCFIFWKSGHSDLVIDTWNRLLPLPIGRTVDQSDLIALLALPFSYVYGERLRSRSTKGIAPYLIAVIALVAFTATQFRKDEGYNDRYLFDGSKAQLITQMERLRPIEYFGRKIAPDQQPDTFEIGFDDCTHTALIDIKGENSQSVINLKKLVYRCPTPERRRMLRFFEREFIEKLREDAPVASAVISSIWLSRPVAAAQ